MIAQALTHGATDSPTHDFALLCNRPRKAVLGPPEAHELKYLRQIVKWEKLGLCQCAQELELRRSRFEFYQERLLECEKLFVKPVRLPSPSKVHKVEAFKKKLDSMDEDEILDMITQLKTQQEA